MFKSEVQAERDGELKHLNHSNICVLWLFLLFETVSYVSQTGRSL